jgi:hypothetical protein
MRAIVPSSIRFGKVESLEESVRILESNRDLSDAVAERNSCKPKNCWHIVQEYSKLYDDFAQSWLHE